MDDSRPPRKKFGLTTKEVNPYLLIIGLMMKDIKKPDLLDSR
jgi:hypothetical protein